MTGNTEALKERYDFFVKGDLERALDLWADDIVWNDESEGLPGSGLHSGKQAATAVLIEAVGAYDTFVLSANEFIEQGDTVVVLGHQEVTKGDRTATVPFVHIWTYRGDQVSQVRLMSDTLATAKLFGLA